MTASVDSSQPQSEQAAHILSVGLPEQSRGQARGTGLAGSSCGISAGRQLKQATQTQLTHRYSWHERHRHSGILVGACYCLGVAVKKDPAQTEDAKISRLAAGPPQASTDLLADDSDRSLAGSRGQQLQRIHYWMKSEQLEQRKRND